MGEKIIENTDDSLALIRSKVKEDVVKSDFRRKLIGGISEDDVEDYINMIQLQFQYKENKLKEQIDELISLKDKLRVEFNTYIEKAEAEKKKLLKDLETEKASLEDYVNQCKAKDIQLSELEGYKTELDQERASGAAIKAENEQLKQKLKDMEKQLEDSHNKNQELRETRVLAEQQLQEERLRLLERNKDVEALTSRIKKQEYDSEMNSKAKQFNSELDVLYKELESVKEQIKVNNELQYQLELEKQKSEKTEREISDFFQSILELKDKIGKSKEI